MNVVRFIKKTAPILAALALFSLASCASEDVGTTPAPDSARVEVRQAAAPPAPSATASPVPAPAPTPAATASATTVPTSTPMASATTVPTSAPTATRATVPTPAPTAHATPVSMPTASASATPIHTPAPTASATPVPAPAPSDGFDAFAFLRTFTRDYSPRESAAEGELRAARFLQAELDGMGYETELRGFEIRRIAFDVSVSPIPDGLPASLDAYRIALSGEGTAQGVLADAGAGFAEDIPPGGLAGKVALIERGTITFEEKVHRAADAGAVAAIVFNNVPGPFSGTLATHADIPAASIDRDSGLRLRSAARDGEIAATVSARPTVSQSRNLVARMPGADGAAADFPTVIIGAHYDTVADTQGANDNGSGVAALMEVAKRARGQDYPFAVRFILFGAEEIGLYGSRRYADEMSAREISGALAMLNLDAVGSGDGFGAIGDAELTGGAQEIGAEIGERVLARSSENFGFTSDHAPFAERGIPAIFLFADDMSRINSPQDELEYVNPRLPGASAEIAMRLLERLAERVRAEDGR